MRSDKVSNPCNSRNELNGLIQGPVSRNVSTVKRKPSDTQNDSTNTPKTRISRTSRYEFHIVSPYKAGVGGVRTRKYYPGKLLKKKMLSIPQVHNIRKNGRAAPQTAEAP